MRIVEIFDSIDGEINAFHQGRLTTFIRVAGCNLSCDYCDTNYARPIDSGQEMPLDQIGKQIQGSNVTITGGEPLLQKEDFVKLFNFLYGKNIVIETNGTFPIPKDLLLKRNKISWVMDYKLSNHVEKDSKLRQFSNYQHLGPNDFVKFVIGDMIDFQESLNVLSELSHMSSPHFAFSPLSSKLSPKILMGWMQTAKLHNCFLNIQLHKLIDIK